MGVSWVRGRALGCGLGVVLGCSGSSVFLCEDDGDCQQDGASGQCQATGYCSFPDAQCPSGQRYGIHVGGSLAQTCVDLDALTSETGVSNDDAGTSRGSTGGPSTMPPTTGLDGPSTTEPLGGTQTSTGASSGGSGDGEPGTTSAGGVVCWVDDFDDGVIDGAWCLSSDRGIDIDEPRGHLRFDFVPARWNVMGGDGNGQATTCDVYPLLGSEARVELAAVPQVSPYTEAYIEVGTESLRLGLGVVDDELYAFEWNGVAYGGSSWQPYVPAAQRWLRISGTDQGLVAEHSPDGVAWVHVHTVPADLSGLEGTAAIGAWSEQVPLGPDEASFESFELCAG